MTNNLSLGENSTGNGTYNLSGGSLGVAANEFIGNSGTGTFNQTTAASTRWASA